MPGFEGLLSSLDKNRRASVMSQLSMASPATSDFIREPAPILFPAAFGVAAGDRFDDVASVPKGLRIVRIKSITLHHGAWIDSIVAQYELSDGSLMTCANGPRGARSTTYTLEPHETLLGLGGLLGFIKSNEIIKDDLILDYLQFHIKDNQTGLVRVVPDDPESYTSNQGADFFIQGPILAFAGRIAGYVCQIQPYLAKEKSDEEFGLPAPGLAWDDRKKIAHSHKDRIRRIKSFTVRAASWIDGFDVTYQLLSGKEVTYSHGGTGGVASTTELAECEVLEALSICNSGPFPFCDSLRLYVTQYSSTGDIVSRRTIPEKSDPSFGYEYEFGENLWIRTGKGSTIFAFAGRSGSYIEQLGCWIRDVATGEEKLVQPAKISSNKDSKRLSTVSLLTNSAALGVVRSPAGAFKDFLVPEEGGHKRSFSTLDVPIPSSSLNVLSGGLGFGSGASSQPISCGGGLTFGASPELILPSSLPSSPSLPTASLRRLSIASSNNGSDGGENSPRSAPKKRLSGTVMALKHGDEVHRLAREQQEKQKNMLVT